jgi:hypothetical protein
MCSCPAKSEEFSWHLGVLFYSISHRRSDQGVEARSVVVHSSLNIDTCSCPIEDEEYP